MQKTQVKKIFVAFLSIVFIVAAQSQDSGNDFSETGDDAPPLAYEEVKSIEGEKSQVTIKTNVRAAEIYLNGVFQGKSQLTINDLLPGTYSLTVRKSGCEKKSFLIETKPGESYVFYAELLKVERK